MKIRTGFVSNSSSSSFVVLLSKEQDTEFQKKLSPIQKEVLGACAREEKIFLGNDVVAYTGWSNAGGYSNFEDVYIDDEGLDENEYYEKYGRYPYASEFFDDLFPEDAITIGVDF